ncbi:MAG: hypothetical protein ACRC0A_07530 [Chitinophagaceae bacterium]
MITAKLQQMDLREAKKWLEKGDSEMIAEKLGCSKATVSYVLNMRNKKVEHAIIALAEKRREEHQTNIEEILK